MQEVAIVSAVRTPIGKFGGALGGYTAAQLGSVALAEAVKRGGVAPDEVAEVFFGNARQAGGGPNVARQVSVKAGLPVETPAVTINQACGSGLRSIFMGAEAIMLGRSNVVAVGGVENMSRVPHLLDRGRWGYRLGNAEVIDAMYRDGLFCPICEQIMGDTAVTLAREYDVSRAAQDAFALDSQRKAEEARAAGRFAAEMVAVPAQPGVKGSTGLDHDEHPRASTTTESLAKLSPVYGDSITAGNASGITDGAASLVLMSRAEAERRGVKPLAYLRQYATVGLDPARMGLGAALAAKRALELAGQQPSDMDVIEVNEAFAAQVLACQKLYELPAERINVNGGSIALGHPIGCTGSRIAVTLLHELERCGGRYGMATLCVSGGLGLAAIFERPSTN